MSAVSQLSATKRTVTGGTSRRLAHLGQVPAVLYGAGHEPLSLAIDRHDLELFTAHHATGALLVDVVVEGEKKPIHAMFKEVQRDPLKGTIMHLDLLAVTANKPVHATVALHLINDPAGVKAGGNLVVSVHEVNVEAKPADLPEAVELDVAALEIGDTVHVRDITAPAGVTILDDMDEVVASVQGARAEEEEAEAAPAEPELIGAEASEDE